MRITEKLAAKLRNNWEENGVTLAFLGDSVTQGCFEIYRKLNGDIETIFDQEYGYHNYVKRILSMLYPNVPINIINAGISGGNAVHGNQRVESHVLRYSPDLTVVCFGLNDSCGGQLDAYCAALREIFRKLQEAGSEVIFMTPNMMATEISPYLPETFRPDAAGIIRAQTEGRLEQFLDAAKQICSEMNVPVCDCYAKWKRMYEVGINTTDLLSNQLNHPTREMNWLFANALVETMLSI